MGTGWSVCAATGDPAALGVAIETVLTGVVARMSQWEAGSALSRFNRGRIGAWQPLPADLLHVVAAGLAVAAASDGAFDPAVGACVDAWGFGPRARPAPAGDHPGWRAIELAPGHARRLAPVRLDLGGIAKGHAVDAVAVALTAMGVTSALVEVGGELRGLGLKPDGQPWWVDVENPPGLDAPPLRLALAGVAVATSGDYRRWRIVDGRRVAHSIDPRLGAPVANRVAAVTVVHADPDDAAMLADAWATALLVLGAEAGMARAAELGLAVRMLVRTRGTGCTEHLSPAFAAMLD